MAEILLYETIGESFWGDGISAKAFNAKLAALGDVPEITLRINSPGGSVFDGLAIYNSLVKHPAKIHVEIDGIAASAASFIAMAGDTIKAAANSFIMVHRAMGLTTGNAAEMRKQADVLEKLDGQIAATYAGRTKRDVAEHLAEMEVETWFTAEEAMAAKFVDSVSEAKEITARFDVSVLGNFAKAPAGLRERLSTAKAAIADRGQAMRRRAESVSLVK